LERFERELLADGAGGGAERHASRFLGGGTARRTKRENGGENSLTILTHISFYLIGNGNEKIRNVI
jgi:hypothetical protein